MKAFATLTKRGQTRRLRGIAVRALDHYALDVRRVRLLTDDTNAIFRVEVANGEKVVLRVWSPANCHDLDTIQAELHWLAAIRRDTELGVPDPIATQDGNLVLTMEDPGVPEPRFCVVFSWVPGPDLGDRATPETVRALGRFAAELHEQAASFRPPSSFHIRTLDKVFPYADPSFRFTEPTVLFDPSRRELFPRRRREVYRRAADRVQRTLDRLYADRNGLRVIHADLHPWNVKVHRGRLYAFDFEDLMWGFPVQDVATTLFYFQRDERQEALFDAFESGYTSHSAWPEDHPGQIETLMAGRNLLLANYVAASEDPHLREIAPDYVGRVETRLRAWLRNA